MIVFINGRFVPEDQAVVSVFDRGFLYGDGLFETMRVCAGAPFRWDEHLQRWEHGARLLNIQPPYRPTEIRGFTSELIARNRMPDALLRLTLSRGVGLRGYSPKGALQPTFILSLHPAPPLNPQEPPLWRAITSSVRLPANEALAQAKTANKLAQIMARAEADSAGVEEALLLNTDGYVAEASSSNLFWIQDGSVCTPALASGALPGVTRSLVLELCSRLEVPNLETNILPSDLARADGAFLTLSSLGVAELLELDGQALKRSPNVDKIRRACYEAMTH